MRLKGKKIAIFIEDIYEDLEFWYPYYRMKEDGAEVTIVGSTKESYSGKNGVPAKADIKINDAKTGDFDALIIPGGYAPDRMRRASAMVEFVKAMHEEGKVIAAICHAGWMLISADVLNGKKVTSFFSIKDDMINAGANWVDEEVVRDGNLVTSRKPDDLPAFCQAIIGLLS
ncbi:type 1 glutamine amidotransferase [candidate division KSB1 bacterium]|nr:type 1 glutamine amidotransferase [candidate division KSB1 bacterium]NIR68509.1 type 1 glutamine amidotransferase [candidate division KSB1 bacterium]NIS22523.1 type 1 glutamine amidotransferase [candidate division KSB1 bacterium]NIT69367.1 type 1 glutamine amidotransferase [candidate division KSB1 bacterium]NIU23028.1 type 1 glutamine amidotransferase [candidate division KSB1 bacterium]